jgi:hypothetical protein
LLTGEADAREALWVCEASGVEELVALAKKFDTATRQEERAVQLRTQEAQVEASAAALRGATPQDLAWSRDTSGFGLSRPLEIADQPEPRTGGWLKASTWLRRNAAN